MGGGLKYTVHMQTELVRSELHAAPSRFDFQVYKIHQGSVAVAEDFKAHLSARKP